MGTEHCVDNVFDLIQQFQGAVAQGHKTCSLDCQKRLQVGWYDCDTQEWFYCPLNVVKIVSTKEVDKPWQDLGIAGIPGLRDIICSDKDRATFFGERILKIEQEMRCAPVMTPEQILGTIKHLY